MTSNKEVGLDEIMAAAERSKYFVQGTSNAVRIINPAEAGTDNEAGATIDTSEGRPIADVMRPMVLLLLRELGEKGKND